MKQLLFTLCALFIFGSVAAQPPMGPRSGMGNGPKKSPAERIAHITKELGLTAEQAEKFAPIYLAYQNDVRNIRKDLKKLMDSYKGQEIDEKVAFKLVMAQLSADADIIACKKEHMRVFKSYLTPEQMAKIFIVEKQRPQRPPRPQGDKPADGK